MTPASSFPARPDGAPLPGADGARPTGGRSLDALPPGTLLGGAYRVERTLGQGGFGIVYLAIDLALQRPVAVKEFLPVHLALRLEGLQIGLREPAHRDAFGRGLQSFLREARLLAQFDHPSLVRVYRFWEEHETAYMAMPYFEGPTLAAARRQMLRPPDQAWLRDQLLLPLLGALQTLHDAHCLHRDVAPGNILLLPDGRPILLDFGSARRVVGDMTQPLTAIVNPAYAAIEQYAESPSLPQGPWTDLYGLACVAYFALSGRAPTPATVRAVNETALMPMAEVGQAVAQSFPGLHYGPAFLAAIDRALSLRPADRPQSAAELRVALTSPHVLPDVAFEEPRSAVPPSFEEIRVPRDPEPDAPGQQLARSDGLPPEALAEAPQDDEQAAIRATIQTALGEIAQWPTIAPRASTRDAGRVEPVFGATTGATAPQAGRTAASGQVHLAVVASAQMREDDDTALEQPPTTAHHGRDPVRIEGRISGGEGVGALAPRAPVAPGASLAASPDGEAGAPRPDFGNVSAGEPPLGEPASAFAFDGGRRRDDGGPSPSASPPAGGEPPSAEVVPFETAASDEPRRPAHAAAQGAPAAAPSRGQGLKAAAAVIAAALLGGGLWYAQDLSRLAWQWSAWGGDDQAASTATAPAATGAHVAQASPSPSATAAPVPNLAAATSSAPEPATAPPPVRAPAPTSALPALPAAPAPAAAPAVATTLALATPSSQAPNASPTRRPAPGGAGTSGTVAAAPASDRSAAATTATPARTRPDAGTPLRAARVAPSPTHVATTAHTPSTHAARAAPAYPPTARAACGARRNFALYYCMKAQCRLERYTRSAECVRLREDDDVE